MYRTPTQKEELRAWRDLAHQLHLHRCITMNHEAVVKILDRMHSWTAAHGDGNGQASAREVLQRVNKAFWEQIMHEGHAAEVLKKARRKISKEEAEERRRAREYSLGGYS